MLKKLWIQINAFAIIWEVYRDGYCPCFLCGGHGYRPGCETLPNRVIIKGVSELAGGQVHKLPDADHPHRAWYECPVCNGLGVRKRAEATFEQLNRQPG